jgi:hypothetical protein
MAKPWWFWIVFFGVLVICLLSGIMIARSRSGLDEKELAVVRRAAGPGLAGGGAGGGGGLFDLVSSR